MTRHIVAIASSLGLLTLAACASSNEVSPVPGEVIPSLKYRSDEGIYIHVVQQEGWYVFHPARELLTTGLYDVGGGEIDDCSTQTMDCIRLGRTRLIAWPRPFTGGSWEFAGTTFEVAVVSAAEGTFLVSPSRDGATSMSYVITCPQGVRALIFPVGPRRDAAERYDLEAGSAALLQGCAAAEPTPPGSYE